MAPPSSGGKLAEARVVRNSRLCWTPAVVRRGSPALTSSGRLPTGACSRISAAMASPSSGESWVPFAQTAIVAERLRPRTTISPVPPTPIASVFPKVICATVIPAPTASGQPSASARGQSTRPTFRAKIPEQPGPALVWSAVQPLPVPEASAVSGCDDGLSRPCCGRYKPERAELWPFSSGTSHDVASSPVQSRGWARGSAS